MSYLAACLVLALSLIGCQGFGTRGPAEESRVDTEVIRPAPPSLPRARPESPQKGFEQEAPKAQNP